jgi:site-specific DNA recombinase
MSTPKTGPASFGFERKDGKLVTHLDEAPIRRRIFVLFAEHKRKKTVAEILNADGVRTRNGAMFTGQTISRLLQEERVTGIPGEVDALITQELFDQCNVILQSQSREGGAKRKTVHLFAGFVVCSCGEKMYVPSNSDKYICSECRMKIPQDDLEAIFHEQLKTFHPPSSMESGFTNALQSWPNLSFEIKREIVESVTDHLEIDDKKVTCFLLTL